MAAVLPGVPTLAELGYPSANLSSTFGLFAPVGTPTARIEQLNALFNELLSQPEMRERLAAANNLATGGSAADFERHIARQRALIPPTAFSTEGN